MENSARICYTDSLYKIVLPETIDLSTGVIIPNGQTIAITRFRANGFSIEAYVFLVYDYGGNSERIFSSTKGDIDIIFDTTNINTQIIGDGIAKLQIALVNNSLTDSPIIGGAFEVTIL